jgi:hypothetical protein
MPYTHEQLLKIDKPADVVWEWMSDARRLLEVNMFHESVDWPEPITEAGARVPVPHNFFGMYRQKRGAYIREYRKYRIAFGEFKMPDEKGHDPFPHSQSFTIVPVDDESCIVINRIRGTYVFPGAKYVGERLFRRYMPTILHDDNCVIAIAVGAMEPHKLPKPKGLFLWPFMAIGGKVVKRSTRRAIVKAAKGEKKKKKRDSEAARDAEPASADNQASAADAVKVEEPTSP